MTMEATIVHGTVRGFFQGCRSRGGCPNHESSDLVTCADAHILRSGDFAFTAAGVDEPIRRRPVPVLRQASAPARVPAAVPRTRRPAPRERSPRESTISHGTVTGYLKGCRSAQSCPAQEQGRATCAEVRNAARRQNARARGVPPRSESVDASPAALRIEQLRREGLSLREIARMSSVGHTTVTNVARGVTRRVQPETLSRLLADLSHAAGGEPGR